MAKPKTPAEEAADLREAVREAHEAMKGLRDLMREIRTLRAEVEETASRVFDERMASQIQAGLASYDATIKTAIDAATDAVDQRFKTITDILLGEDRESVRKGLPSLTDYAHQIAAQRGAER